MDENRVTGTARNVGGKVQEAAGKFTGDTKLKAQGVVNQAAGDIEDLYGQAKECGSRCRRVRSTGSEGGGLPFSPDYRGKAVHNRRRCPGTGVGDRPDRALAWP